MIKNLSNAIFRIKRMFDVIDGDIDMLFHSYEAYSVANTVEKRYIKSNLIVRPKLGLKHKREKLSRMLKELAVLEEDIESTVPRGLKKLTISDLISDVISQPEGKETITGDGWKIIIERTTE